MNLAWVHLAFNQSMRLGPLHFPRLLRNNRLRFHVFATLVDLKVGREPISASKLIESICKILIPTGEAALRLVSKGRKDLIYRHVILDLWWIE